jgi:hypothetical protein
MSAISLIDVWCQIKVSSVRTADVNDFTRCVGRWHAETFSSERFYVRTSPDSRRQDLSVDPGAQSACNASISRIHTCSLGIASGIS